MRNFGIANGLNLYVLAADDEFGAVRALMDSEFLGNDDHATLVGLPHLPGDTPPPFIEIPLLVGEVEVGEVIDKAIRRYGGALTIGAGAVADAFHGIMTFQNESVKRYIAVKPAIQVSQNTYAQRGVTIVRDADVGRNANNCAYLEGYLMGIVQRCKDNADSGCPRELCMCGLCVACCDDKHGYTGCVVYKTRPPADC